MCHEIKSLGDFEFMLDEFHTIKDIDGKWITNPEPKSQSVIDAINSQIKAIEN